MAPGVGTDDDGDLVDPGAAVVVSSIESLSLKHTGCVDWGGRWGSGGRETGRREDGRACAVRGGAVPGTGSHSGKGGRLGLRWGNRRGCERQCRWIFNDL